MSGLLLPNYIFYSTTESPRRRGEGEGVEEKRGEENGERDGFDCGHSTSTKTQARQNRSICLHCQVPSGSLFCKDELQ